MDILQKEVTCALQKFQQEENAKWKQETAILQDENDKLKQTNAVLQDENGKLKHQNISFRNFLAEVSTKTIDEIIVFAHNVKENKHLPYELGLEGTGRPLSPKANGSSGVRRSLRIIQRKRRLSQQEEKFDEKAWLCKLRMCGQKVNEARQNRQKALKELRTEITKDHPAFMRFVEKKLIQLDEQKRIWNYRGVAAPAKRVVEVKEEGSSHGGDVRPPPAVGYLDEDSDETDWDSDQSESDDQSLRKNGRFRGVATSSNRDGDSDETESDDCALVVESSEDDSPIATSSDETKEAGSLVLRAESSEDDSPIESGAVGKLVSLFESSSDEKKDDIKSVQPTSAPETFYSLKERLQTKFGVDPQNYANLLPSLGKQMAAYYRQTHSGESPPKKNEKINDKHTSMVCVYGPNDLEHLDFLITKCLSSVHTIENWSADDSEEEEEAPVSIVDSAFDNPPEERRLPDSLIVRGFPSRSAGDPDDEFDSIRK